MINLFNITRAHGFPKDHATLFYFFSFIIEVYICFLFLIWRFIYAGCKLSLYTASKKKKSLYTMASTDKFGVILD